MNWLITGGCGFIGRNLIKHILFKYPTSSIRILDNLSVGKPSDLEYATREVTIVTPKKEMTWLPKTVQLIEGDIMDATLAIEVSKNANIVVHLAANTGVGPSVEEPREDCLTNVIGTFNYLDACRKNEVGRFIFASSGAPIGDCIPPIHEEIACHPISPYGASKMAGEGYCSAYYRSFGLETVALRFGNAYGPGSQHKNSVIAKFIRLARNGKTLEIYGDGSQTRDFIFVEDIVEAILASSTQKARVGGQIFQIATNQETTVLELANELKVVLEEAEIRNVTINHVAQRTGDALRNYSDTSKAKAVLGWTHKTNLKEGLRRTLQHAMSSDSKV